MLLIELSRLIYALDTKFYWLNTEHWTTIFNVSLYSNTGTDPEAE